MSLVLTLAQPPFVRTGHLCRFDGTFQTMGARGRHLQGSVATNFERPASSVAPLAEGESTEAQRASRPPSDPGRTTCPQERSSPGQIHHLRQQELWLLQTARQRQWPKLLQGRYSGWRTQWQHSARTVLSPSHSWQLSRPREQS